MKHRQVDSSWGWKWRRGNMFSPSGKSWFQIRVLKDTMAQFGLCSIHPALFKDYILHFGSEANKSFAGSLGGWSECERKKKKPSSLSLPASLRRPDRLWQRELRANRLDNKCLRQPYKLRMTYDEVLWSERQDRKYQDLICVRLAMMVMNSCGWVGLCAKVCKFMQWRSCMKIPDTRRKHLLY